MVLGPVIVFNLQWQDGFPIGYAEVQRLAVIHNIQMRTGSLTYITLYRKYIEHFAWI